MQPEYLRKSERNYNVARNHFRPGTPRSGYGKVQQEKPHPYFRKKAIEALKAKEEGMSTFQR
jgi:hypothetical protein